MYTRHKSMIQKIWIAFHKENKLTSNMHKHLRSNNMSWTYQHDHDCSCSLKTAASRLCKLFDSGATTASQDIGKTLAAPQASQSGNWKIGVTNDPSTFEQRLIAPLMDDKGLSIGEPLHTGIGRRLGRGTCRGSTIPGHFDVTVTV